MLRQHQTQRSPNAHHNHHNVHGDGDEARVVDVVVLDVAALVGQEEAKHNQQALVDVESSDQVVEVVTLALFVDLQSVLFVVLVESVSGAGNQKNMHTHKNTLFCAKITTVKKYQQLSCLLRCPYFWGPD